jgi:hypothetical protein
MSVPRLLLRVHFALAGASFGIVTPLQQSGIVVVQSSRSAINGCTIITSLETIDTL